jgi:hypothetical protein
MCPNAFAILENYQRTDGSIVIPPVFRPRMDGRETISRSSRLACRPKAAGAHA